MNDWLPIALAILAFAAVSGAIRRRVAPLRGERRLSKKGALIQSVGTIVLVAIFLVVALAILGSMAKQ